MSFTMIDFVGTIGGGLFALGCTPMAWRTWKAGHDLGTPLETQWLLFVACIVYSMYLFAAFGSHLPFWFLVIEVVCWGVALWYSYFPRKPRG